MADAADGGSCLRPVVRSAWQDGAGPWSPAVPEDAGLGPATTVSRMRTAAPTPCAAGGRSG